MRVERDNRQIGLIMRALRARRGCTQETMALELGMKANELSRWECGRLKGIHLLIVLSSEEIADLAERMFVSRSQAQFELQEDGVSFAVMNPSEDAINEPI